VIEALHGPDLSSLDALPQRYADAAFIALHRLQLSWCYKFHNLSLSVSTVRRFVTYSRNSRLTNRKKMRNHATRWMASRSSSA
jgi:hypothetical protein